MQQKMNLASTASHRLPVLALLLLVCQVQGSDIEHGGWNYAERGPATWAQAYPQYCAGRKQSPIALTQKEAVQDSTLQEYVIRVEEAAEYSLDLLNDGHKILISLGSSDKGQLAIRMGQGDIMYYTAAQLHWHWGADDSRGSEHTMDGKEFPMEGHLVFWNSFDYANFSTAVHRVGGLAVLGVFYQLSETDNPLFKALEPYMPALTNFSGNASARFQASKLNFVDAFLPDSRRHFYRYEGGLTTPTCNENVLWTVYRQPVPISARQMRLLRALRYPNGSPMVDNYRPPQPLNSAHRPGANRVLYRSFNAAGLAVGDTGYKADNVTCGASPIGLAPQAAIGMAAFVALISAAFY